MPQPANDKLSSWKEIATYLDKDVRTAMRYEQERGMPVRRVPGGKRATGVYAYRHELDAWLHGQPDPLPASAAGRWRAWGVALGLLAVAAALAIALWNPPGPPVRVSCAGSRLVAWDARGRLAWEYEFSEAIEQPTSTYKLNSPTQIEDLDGDGRPEILAIVAFPGRSRAATRAPQELWCFSTRGSVLWRYQPDLTLRFGGQPYSGPWHFEDLIVSPGPAPRQVLVSFAHHTWWPSFVVRLDQRGRAEIRFVQSGAVHSLNYLRSGAKTYVLAGGINNEYSAASLAVLEDRQPPATSPQAPGSAFHCDGCPAGQPVRYYLFPASELVVAEASPYNRVMFLRVFDERLQVMTEETSHMHAYYEFSSDFEPAGASLGDGAAALHRRLEAEGKLKHSWERCPERPSPKKIRLWTAESGWRELAVPWGRRQQ
jgi:hypothetical protein